MQEHMKTIKKDDIRSLFKVIGKVTIESLPELVELTPVYGPLLSKVLEKVLAINGVYLENKNEIQIQEQINALKQIAMQEKLSNEEFKKEFENEIQKELGNYLKKEELCIPAYMCGIIVYVYEDYSLIDEEQETLEYIFDSSNEDICEEDFETYERIRNFMREYCTEYYQKDIDYYITKNCIIINFFTDWGKPKKNDEDICQFIYDLNSLMEGKPFTSYMIF